MKKNNATQPEGNYFDKYHSSNPIVKWMMQNFFHKLDVLLSDVGPVSHILEAGCGEGEVTHFLSLRYGTDCQISAFDISEKVIAEAQKKYPDIHFSAQSIYHIETRGGTTWSFAVRFLNIWIIPHLHLPSLKRLPAAALL